MNEQKSGDSPLGNSPLGKASPDVSVYTPSLLHPISRRDGRTALGLDPDAPPFKGMDLWTAYELSWLDTRGKPQVALGQLQIPANTPCLVESKSLKLYLNSLNQTSFRNFADVTQTLESDLSTAAGGPVMVSLTPLSAAERRPLGHFPGESIDHLEVAIDDYELMPSHLTVGQKQAHETLHTDLFRSNCPVTGQPDWASVMVSYRGLALDRAGLLKYLVSYRQHQDFHENCVERMFVDILEHCRPETLTVAARFTRRGGLDINPYRSNCGEAPPDIRIVRQ